MPESKIAPQQLVNFGRSFSLLFNRSTMYDADHPYCKQAIDNFLPTVQDIVKSNSPLVFIMNQEQFFVDDEPIDPRINISKMVAHFKKAEIQSISFYEGLEEREMRAFVKIFTSLKVYPHVNDMKKALDDEGIKNLKINYIFFKKVSTDEEVVSREAFEKISPEIGDAAQVSSKKLFMDMVLESVLTEEFEKALSIKNIVENPAKVSKNMINTDLETYHQSDAEDKQPGLVLVRQLQMIEEEVEKKLFGAGEGTGGGVGTGGDEGTEMSELAAAVLDMKRQLINGIELQKSLGITYLNEEKIVDKSNEITDRVLIQLVRDEYKSGEISTARLAQILRRLIPEPDELKRLLPKIKDALLEEGMPLPEYLNLVQEFGKELQSEELSKILKESAEMVGLEGDDLIQEVKENPVQAAELIFLAAEIRKGSGDDDVLTDLLVEYVERIGSKLTLDIAKEDKVEGEQHLRQVMGGVESQIISRLRDMDVKNDVLDRLEERLTSRMDEIFESIKEKWTAFESGQPEKEGQKDLSVLQILEQSVGEGDELGKILKMVRTEAKAKGLNENDFKKIFAEITRQKENKQKRKIKKKKPEGVLDSKGLIFSLEKEIARAVRYDLPFATLSFSIVTATPKKQPPSGSITKQSLADAVLQKLATEIRGADMAALLDKKKFVAFLRMTP